MILFTDAGRNKRWSFVVITNPVGVVMGRKVFVTKEHMTIAYSELIGVIAAMHILKIRSKPAGRKDVIITDNEQVVVWLTRTKVKTKNKSLEKLFRIGRRLQKETNCHITWLPRELNVAGNLLTEFRKSAYMEASDLQEAFYRL